MYYYIYNNLQYFFISLLALPILVAFIISGGPLFHNSAVSLLKIIFAAVDLASTFQIFGTPRQPTIYFSHHYTYYLILRILNHICITSILCCVQSKLTVIKLKLPCTFLVILFRLRFAFIKI